MKGYSGVIMEILFIKAYSTEEIRKLRITQVFDLFAGSAFRYNVFLIEL